MYVQTVQEISNVDLHITLFKMLLKTRALRIAHGPRAKFANVNIKRFIYRHPDTTLYYVGSNAATNGRSLC